MASGSYRNPSRPDSTRVRCPVCHEEVYSPAGIHPQCAVKQSDPPKPKPRAAGAAVPAVPADGGAGQAAAVGAGAPDLNEPSPPARTAG